MRSKLGEFVTSRASAYVVEGRVLAVWSIFVIFYFELVVPSKGVLFYSELVVPSKGVLFCSELINTAHLSADYCNSTVFCVCLRILVSYSRHDHSN